jgi:histidinol dehydrogenase
MSSIAKQIRQLSTADADFEQQLIGSLQRDMLIEEEVVQSVKQILADVRARGDAALVDYTNKFDGFNAKSMDELVIDQQQLHAALDALDEDQANCTVPRG